MDFRQANRSSVVSAVQDDDVKIGVILPPGAIELLDMRAIRSKIARLNSVDAVAEERCESPESLGAQVEAHLAQSHQTVLGIDEFSLIALGRHRTLSFELWRRVRAKQIVKTFLILPRNWCQFYFNQRKD
jgi:hypothetical protein